MRAKKVSKYKPVFSDERGLLENSIEACTDFECIYKNEAGCVHPLSENKGGLCDLGTCAFASNCYCCKKQPRVEDRGMKPIPILCRKSGERSMLDKTSLPEDAAASKRREAIIASGSKRKENLVSGLDEIARSGGFELIDRNNIVEDNKDVY